MYIQIYTKNSSIGTSFDPVPTVLTLTALGGGGGQIGHATQSFEEKKCPCSHNNDTASIKQISLFDTALVMTNT